MNESNLFKRYDLSYNKTQCRDYKIGVMVQFYDGKLKKEGIIHNIVHKTMHEMIIYEVLTTEETVSLIYRLKRSDIIGLAPKK